MRRRRDDEMDYTDGNLYTLRMATRLWMEHITQLPLMEPILEVGPAQPGGVFVRMPDTWFDLREMVKPKAYFTLDRYGPADIVADITQLPPGYRNTFGTIVCLHVLEHVSNPFLALWNMARMLSAGGRLYVLVPWALRLHGPRPDCWRISDDGLRALATGWLDVESVEKIGDGLNPVGFKAVLRKPSLMVTPLGAPAYPGPQAVML